MRDMRIGRPVHFNRAAACGLGLVELHTDVPTKVTCAKCRKTTAWKHANTKRRSAQHV